MNQAQELHIMVQEAKEANSTVDIEHRNITSQSSTPKNYKRWIRIAIYTLCVLSGQSISVLLGRLYFSKGGNSKWMATLVQLVGFPILLPYYCLSPPKRPSTISIQDKPPSPLVLGSIYVSLGLFVAADCFLYSVGLMYLPVSTYSLICASQLAFNSFFSYFLNSQKFTPFIVNSLVLLTISSTLLVFHGDSENPTGVTKVKYAIGFICTVGASAGYGLVLSLTQLCFHKVLKKGTFSVVIDMMIYQSLVASSVIVVGLFASGEWRTLKGEMASYELGKISYIVNLVCTAIFWQLFAIGVMGLIFEVSSLFSNVIGVFGLPVVPVLAVIFLHDKMDGVKVIAMVLAIWGFVSYVYQQYLDDYHPEKGKRNAGEAPKRPLTEDAEG